MEFIYDKKILYVVSAFRFRSFNNIYLVRVVNLLMCIEAKTRGILCVLAFLLMFSGMDAQSFYRHDKTITQLLVDSLGQLYFIDQDNAVYLYSKGRPLKTDLSISSKDVIQDASGQCHVLRQNKAFNIQDGQLIEVPQGLVDYPFSNLKGVILRSNDESRLIIEELSTGGRCQLPEQIDYNSPLRLVNYKNDYLAVYEHHIIFACTGKVVTADALITDAVITEEHLLIGTKNNGLWVLKDSTMRKLYQPGVTFPSSVLDLHVGIANVFILDANNNLWSYNLKAQTLAFVDERISSWILDPWDKLWYVTKNEIRSSDDYINNKAPILLLSNDSLNKDSVLINIRQSETIDLDFRAFFSPAQDLLEFQYQIDDKLWASFDGQLVLEALQPGYHELRVRARDAQGHYSEVKHYFILVHQEILLSYWPYIIAGLIGLLLLALWALRQKEIENKKLKHARATAELKMQLLQSEQKFRRAQMNPHFFNNALTAITALIGMGKSSEARQALRYFSTLMRVVLDNSDTDKISIQEEISFLRAYLELEKKIRPYRFEYSIIDKTKGGEIPPMLVQPFV